MRIDSSILESLMDLAKLSTREREAMRLECAGATEDEAIAATMGCAVSSVRTFRSRGRKKILAAQAEWELQQRGRGQEEQDAADLEGARGFYGFILGAMTPPPTSPQTPHFGRTWTDASGHTMAEEGRISAGRKGAVTIEDLMGRGDVGSAWEERVKPRRDAG